MRWPAQAIVLLGPSGVGKGTIVSQIIQDHPDVYVSISATTRQPRSTEVDGVSYFFTSEPEFTAMIGRGELLEWAQVHGQHFYGTPREPIDKALAVGKPVLFEIDLQGARQIKETMPEVRTVFLLPPSWDELVKRLRTRATESEEEIQLRLNTAWGELAQQDEFDVRLVNDDVRKTAQQVVDLMGLNKE
jgi:guanylate kinase